MPMLMSSVDNLHYTTCHSNVPPAQPTPSFLPDNHWQGQAKSLLSMTGSQCRAINTIDMHMVAQANDGEDSNPGEPQPAQLAVPGVVPSFHHTKNNINPPYELHLVSLAQYAMGAVSVMVAIVVFLPVTHYFAYQIQLQVQSRPIPTSATSKDLQIMFPMDSCLHPKTLGYSMGPPDPLQC